MNDHILIVEDSPPQALALKYLLESEGYKVKVANNGHEGLIEVGNQKPQLIISDIMMPLINGYELCSILKSNKIFKDIPVILLTVLVDLEDVIKGLNVQADCYVTKPYDAKFLISKVKSVLAAKEAMETKRRGEALEVVFDGKSYVVESNRQQMLTFLLATYENAIIQNRDLVSAQKTLKHLNEQLEINMQQLKLSEEKFRSLVKTIPDIVYRVNVNGYFTFLNNAVTKIGYEPKELIGKHFTKIIMPEYIGSISRKEVLEKLKGKKFRDEKAPKLFDERRKEDRKTIRLETRLIAKKPQHKKRSRFDSQGSEVCFVEINSSGLYQIADDAKDRHFIGTVGIIRDITDRKAMERKIVKSRDELEVKVRERTADLSKVNESLRTEIVGRKLAEEKHTLIIKTALDGFWVSDLKGRILDVNDAYCNMTGYSREKLLTMAISDLEAQGTPEETVQHLKKVMEQGGERFDSRHRTKDGKILDVEISTNHIEEEGQFFTFIRDVTDRKQTQKSLARSYNKLKESRVQLVHTEKIAALGTLTAGIAHEMNNPMMGILNFVQYCLKHTDRDDKRYTVLEDAEHETKRCVDIVRSLLIFSRIDGKGEEIFEKTNISALLDRVVRLLSYRMEKENIFLNINVAENISEIRAKADSLQQIFINLIGNALDANENDGTKKEIKIDVQNVNESVQAIISDKGSGIAPSIVSKIFDPFFTTKSPGEGTGLGLSICQSIIEEHGGEIICDSEVGVGTTFTIILPVKRIEN